VLGVDADARVQGGQAKADLLLERRHREQWPALEARPSSAAARSRGSCSSSRTRTGQQGRASELQRRDCLIASHRRKLAEKLVQGLAAFEIVEQRLYRNSCSDEHRRAPKNRRVAADDVAQLGHVLDEYTRRPTGRISPTSSRRLRPRPARKELGSGEPSEIIHRFHQGPATELWVRYNKLHLEMAVAFAITTGVLRRETIPAEVLEHLAGALRFYEEEQAPNRPAGPA
jgi:hypothetical protein